MGGVSLNASSEFDSTTNASNAVLQWGSMWRSEENAYQWIQVCSTKLGPISQTDLSLASYHFVPHRLNKIKLIDLFYVPLIKVTD